MQLIQLRNFIAVVECGSIRGAARQLGISQPAATKSLKALEASLDAVLVQRSSRGIVLTPAGKAFVARARAVQNELRQAHEELELLTGQRSETVRIGVASVLGAWLMPPVLQRFRRDWPQTMVHIVEGTQESLLPLLREGALDCAVCLRAEPESTRGFTVRPLAKLRLCVVGRKGHPLRHARSLEQLADASWVISRPRGSGGVLERAFAAAGLRQPALATECDSHAIRVALVAGSETLSLLARPMLSEPGTAAQLQEIPLDTPLPLMTFALYGRGESKPGAAAQAMASCVGAQSGLILRSA